MQIPKLIYDIENTRIIQEGYNRNLTAKTESIFAQGNGYLGIRAVDEEIEAFNKEDFFVNGIFNASDENEVSELANLADLIQTKIVIDNEVFSLAESQCIIHYSKSLDLRNGLLKRRVVWTKKNKVFELLFERIVSQNYEHIYAQKIVIIQTQGESALLEIFPQINGQTTNNGAQHFCEGTKNLVETNCLRYIEQTNQSKKNVIHTMFLRVLNHKKFLKNGNDNFVIQMKRRQVGFKIKTTLNLNVPFILEKIMSVHTSIDSVKKLLSKSEILKNANKDLKILKSLKFDQLIKDSIKIFDQKIYNQFYVKIFGKSSEAKYANLAYLFSLYHANIFVPKNNPFLSVGAKGLTGEGYQGHCFWDTEIFITPNYIFNNPKIARNLLEYRYKGISGARKKALESKLKGAQYPWEMGWPTDGEMTPFWGQPDIVTGKQVPIASRKHEIHVSADIAICIEQYFQATNDINFMFEMGFEMLFDTAWYYAQRVELKNNKYQIIDVMGPNEYKGNIDNNNYINLSACYNLKLALKYLKLIQSHQYNDQWKKYYKKQNSNETIVPDLLQFILKKIPYKIDFDLIEVISEKIKLQLPNKKGIIAENDQFLKLKKISVRAFQFLGDAGKTLFNTKQGIKRLSCQLVKQADVILTGFIFCDVTWFADHKINQSVLQKNFDYYEKITTHDSSLSAAIYAIVANKIGYYDQAYKFFHYGINIDIGSNFHSCDHGIHAGSLAAIWQMIVFGFGGFEFKETTTSKAKFKIKPKIPKTWTSLEYKITVEKSQILVKINQQTFTLVVVLGSPILVNVNNQDVEINKTLKEFKVK